MLKQSWTKSSGKPPYVEILGSIDGDTRKKKELATSGGEGLVSLAQSHFGSSADNDQVTVG